MPLNNRAFLLGLTGTIGSGKSTVANLLLKQIPVYFSDVIANEIVSSEPYRSQIIQRWGRAVLQEEVLNPAAIAKIVFNDAQELRFLNDLIHPPVLEKMDQIAQSSTQRYLCFEVPLLFEAKLEQCFDYIVLVTADPEIRLQRLVKRGKQSREDILARLENQMSDELKIKASDLIIENNATPNELSNKVRSLLSLLPSLAHRNISSFTNRAHAVY